MKSTKEARKCKTSERMNTDCIINVTLLINKYIKRKKL